MVTMDWRLMEKVVNVLKDFNSATEQLSGSSNCIIEVGHASPIHCIGAVCRVQ